MSSTEDLSFKKTNKLNAHVTVLLLILRGYFVQRYHDIANVVDFLVLRQTYRNAVRNDWQVNMRFRSMIDGAWWFGTIDDHQPLNEIFPDSLFLCFHVKLVQRTRTRFQGEFEKLNVFDFAGGTTVRKNE